MQKAHVTSDTHYAQMCTLDDVARNFVASRATSILYIRGFTIVAVAIHV
jgi:hypothetical protein